MNSITIQNVTVCQNFFSKEAVTVTNGVLSFAGYEKDTCHKENKYRNYSFRAYDQVAEKIQKMKLRPGSVVNITGEMDQYINATDNRLMYFVRIGRIEFSPYLLPPQKQDEKETIDDLVKNIKIEEVREFNLSAEDDEELFL